MKSLMTIFTAALLLAGAALAQDQAATAQDNTAQTSAAPGQRMRRPGMQRMLEQLNLSDDQKAQLKTLRDQQRQDIQALRIDQSLTADQRRTQMQAVHQQFRTKMQGILTAEQQKQLQQMRRARGGPMARLNLTDEQKARMKPILEQQRQQMQAIRNDSSLSAQDRQQKMRDLRQNTRSQMRSILTPEQQQQLEQMRQNRRGRHEGQSGPQGF